MQEKNDMHNSEDTEFIITGSKDDILISLMEEFNFSEEQAKIYMLLSFEEEFQTHKLNHGDNELHFWFLNPNKEQHQARIFNTQYSITLNSVKKKSFSLIFNLFINIIGGLGNLPLAFGIAGISLLFDIKSMIQKVEFKDYCVFQQIIEYTKNNKNVSFDIPNIIPYSKSINQEGDYNCERKPTNWICPHLHNEICTVNIDNCLKALEKLDIIEQNNKCWKLVK